MAEFGLKSYIIRGGEEGRARLGILAAVMAPTTGSLLDRLGSIEGQSVIDAACGGGDVSFDLAARVGPSGRVDGLDLDAESVGLARAEAAERGLINLTFHVADVTRPWPIGGAGLVYARFILTHLTDPLLLLRNAMAALVPGGRIVVEDIDMGGGFCDPPCRAYERYMELYIEASRRRGADPLIGRRVARLLCDAGFELVDSGLVQPHGRAGPVKQIAGLTFAAIADGLVSSAMATHDEVTDILAELDAFAVRADTTMSIPRIFQAIGRRPDRASPV